MRVEAMKLTLEQRLNLWQALTLQIKHIQARRVVFLLHHGWRLAKDRMRRFTWLTWPPQCDRIKYKVNRFEWSHIRRWVDRVAYDSKFIYYSLK